MGTFVEELPSKKLERAIKVIKNRLELLPDLPEVKQDEFILTDYGALLDLLKDSSKKVKALEEASIRSNVNYLEAMPAIWVPSLFAACKILGEDPNGTPVDEEGNPLQLV